MVTRARVMAAGSAVLGVGGIAVAVAGVAAVIVAAARTDAFWLGVGVCAVVVGAGLYAAGLRLAAAIGRRRSG